MFSAGAIKAEPQQKLQTVGVTKNFNQQKIQYEKTDNVEYHHA